MAVDYFYIFQRDTLAFAYYFEKITKNHRLDNKSMPKSLDSRDLKDFQTYKKKLKKFVHFSKTLCYSLYNIPHFP